MKSSNPKDPELAAATGGGPMDMAFDEDDTGDEEDAMSISGAEEEEEEDHEEEEDEGDEGHMHDEGEENDVIYEEGKLGEYSEMIIRYGSSD